MAFDIFMSLFGFAVRDVVPWGAGARDMSVLMLHSYHAEYAWTRNQHAGFIAALEQYLPQQDITYFAEYLDTKRKDYTSDYETFLPTICNKNSAGTIPM